MHYNVVLLPGDGIGPEVLAEGVKVVENVGKLFGHTFSLKSDLIGGISIGY